MVLVVPSSVAMCFAVSAKSTTARAITHDLGREPRMRSLCEQFEWNAINESMYIVCTLLALVSLLGNGNLGRYLPR